MPEQRQPAQVGAAGQLDAETVGAASRGLSQGTQVQVEHLRQPLVGNGLAEAKGVLSVEVGRQNDVALSRQRTGQIGKAVVVALFDLRVAGPAVDAMFHLRTAGVGAVDDHDHRERAVALAGRSDDAVQPHGHVAEAAVLREATPG